MESKKLRLPLYWCTTYCKKSDIAKLFKVSRMTVHRVSSHLSEGETLKNLPREGRLRDILTKAYNMMMIQHDGKTMMIGFRCFLRLLRSR